jgi:5-methylcytosine-specific restriction protein A
MSENQSPTEFYFAPVSESERRQEKRKAQELRASQWWRQQIGRGECYHCGERFPVAELTMDHLIPIARGGKSNKKNCVPSCKPCNSQKGYKTRAELALDQIRIEAKDPDADFGEIS